MAESKPINPGKLTTPPPPTTTTTTTTKSSESTKIKQAIMPVTDADVTKTSDAGSKPKSKKQKTATKKTQKIQSPKQVAARLRSTHCTPNNSRCTPKNLLRWTNAKQSIIDTINRVYQLYNCPIPVLALLINELLKFHRNNVIGHSCYWETYEVLTDTMNVKRRAFPEPVF
ncbi:hypothetical protein CHS0354_001317 [Potamilus streckersoni]|uniref:Uncharacterized protein n=1 Tax=Potamilus streckersoni TaxID=2493646 RepID=A0AAE0VJH8_9BIVA|nr:hypothetical protein CHS0354_001317 [Potamilus streckersoni]